MIRSHLSVLIIFLLLVSVSSAFAGGSQEQEQEVDVDVSDVESHPEISILINESPWLDAFREIVELYEDRTGNSVEIVGSPYQALLTRTTNTLTAPESEFDIVILDEVWTNQFYEGELVADLNDIDPDFSFDSEVLEYDWVTRWDHEIGTNAESGSIYGVPINGNMQILYYREDLLSEAGFDPPETWDELLEIAEHFYDPPEMYGMVGRATGRPDFGLQAVLHSYDGYLAQYDPDSETWDIGINNPEAHDALDMWLRMVQDYSPEDYSSIGQADMISLMQSGRVAMTYTVAAAAPQFDHPQESAVVDNVSATVVPGPEPGEHAPTTGIQPFAIPANLPAEQQEAALAFLEWVIQPDVQVEFGRAGGIVTRQDAWETLAEDPDFWWAEAVAESSEYAHGQLRVEPGGRIFDELESLIRQVVVGDISNEEMLEQAEEQIRDIMEEAGYSVQ